MTRFAVVFLGLVLSTVAVCAAPTTGDQCAVQLLVGDGKSVEVVVPCVDREDVTDIVSTFFSRDNKDTKAKFQALLKKAGDLTLTITTKRGPKN